PCNADEHTVIDDYKRDVSYSSPDGEPLQCDVYFQTNWYRFLVNGTDATMPTYCVQPYHCGTQSPVWLDAKDGLPEVDEEQVTRACASWATPGQETDCCFLPFQIIVRNCGDYFVYRLESTLACNIRYCAEKQVIECEDGQLYDTIRKECVEVTTPSAVSAACGQGEQFSQLLGQCVPVEVELDKPIISTYVDDNGGAYVNCSWKPVDPSPNLGVDFVVTWYDEVLETLQPILVGPALKLGQDVFAGTTVVCGVQLSTASQGAAENTEVFSDSYFLGLKIRESELKVREDGRQVNLTLYSTIPIHCGDGVPRDQCRLGLSLLAFGTDGELTQRLRFSTCYVEFSAADCLGPVCSEHVIQIILYPNIEYTPSAPNEFVTVIGALDDFGRGLWRQEIVDTQLELEEIQVAQCHVFTDPHVITFDGKVYDMYSRGTFVLHKSLARDFTMHVRVKECGSNQGFCACGFVARDAGDVVSIDMCEGTIPPGKADVTFPGDFISGDVKVYESKGGKILTVVFASGTLIKTFLEPWGMSLSLIVPATDLNFSRGLCGFYDNDLDNDFHDPQGKVVRGASDRLISLEFVEMWRLPPGRSFFDQPPINDPQPLGLSARCDCSAANSGGVCPLTSLVGDIIPSVVPSEDRTNSFFAGSTFPGGGADDDIPRTVTSDDELNGFEDYNYPEVEFSVVPPVRRRRQAGTPPGTVPDPAKDFKRQANSSAAYFFQPDYLLATTGFIPKWPAASGLSEDEATDVCAEMLFGSDIALNCAEYLRSALGTAFEFCKTDLQVKGNLTWARYTVSLLESLCDIGLLESAYSFREPGQTVPDWPKVLEDAVVCPKGCRNSGQCGPQGCQCPEGFFGPECEKTLAGYVINYTINHNHYTDYYHHYTDYYHHYNDFFNHNDYTNNYNHTYNHHHINNDNYSDNHNHDHTNDNHTNDYNNYTNDYNNYTNDCNNSTNDYNNSTNDYNNYTYDYNNYTSDNNYYNDNSSASYFYHIYHFYYSHIVAIPSPAATTTSTQQPLTTSSTPGPVDDTTVFVDPYSSSTEAVDVGPDVEGSAGQVEQFSFRFLLCDINQERCTDVSFDMVPKAQRLRCRVTAVEVGEGEVAPLSITQPIFTGTTFSPDGRFVCILPYLDYLRHAFNTRRPIDSVRVEAVTEDGNTSLSTIIYTIYDSLCRACGVDGRYGCFTKSNTCYIDGKCYTNRQPQPFDTCLQCRPELSKVTWSTRANNVAPIITFDERPVVFLGQDVRLRIRAVDPDGGRLILSLDRKDAFISQSGLFQWRAIANDVEGMVKTETFVVSARDECNTTASSTLEILTVPCDCQNGGSCINPVVVGRESQYSCVCASGYAGYRCEQEVDECFEEPCVHGTCVDLIDGFRCICEPGFEGDNCDVKSDQCRDEPCYPGVLCQPVGSSFVCGPCPPGYTGDGVNCVELNACASSPCFPGVHCKDLAPPSDGFDCGACPRFFTGDGQTCQRSGESACTTGVCAEQVTCEELTSYPGYRCGPCPSGYSGDGTSCTPICEEPCTAGRICVQPGLCGCRPGYIGDNCNIPSCDPPCANDGRCIGRNRCLCRYGYIGVRCQLQACQIPCQNGGQCVGPNRCRCQSGYQGQYCEQAACYPPCLNGGKCVAPGRCQCPSGYEGLQCERALCYPPCQHGGVCKRFNTCKCQSGYVGHRCQTAVCRPACMNGGRCVAPNTCSCPSGWYGHRCDQPKCHLPCRHGGVCFKPDICVCRRGYGGADCTR
ncbi:hypothetical protein BaRGS_00001152, partial [Batillaria attramentaria]